MPYHYSNDANLFRLVWHGDLAFVEVSEALRLGSRLAQNAAVPILIDMRSVTKSIGIAELLVLIEDSLGLLRGNRHAALYRPGAPGQDLSEVWKLLCSNRGVHVETFTEEANALAWLCDPQRS